VGPFRLAALTRRPVVLMLGLRPTPDRYHLVFEPIADFSQPGIDRAAAVDAALDRYVERLEHHARAHPYDWFNFFDFWAIPPESTAVATPAAASPNRRRVSGLASLAITALVAPGGW